MINISEVAVQVRTACSRKLFETAESLRIEIKERNYHTIPPIELLPGDSTAISRN